MLLVAAVLLAAGGTVAIYSYVGKANARAIAGQEAVTVLVASQDIPAGTPASTQVTSTSTFPRSAVPANAVTDLKQVQNLVAGTAIGKNQLLTTAMFGKLKDDSSRNSAPDKTAGVTLPAGKVAVPVSFSSLTKGTDWQSYVRPGADVAIFLTYIPVDPVTGKAKRPSTDATGTEDKDYDHATTLIVPKARVLAVGDNTTPSAGAKPTKIDETAFLLALSQHDSERLILAMSLDQPIYPVLITKDSKVSVAPGVDQHTILQSIGKD